MILIGDGKCEKLNLRSRELWMTQTILLNQLGLMYSGDRRALELAEIFQAVPVTLARRKRLFTNTLPQERLCRLELPIADKWHVSILDEQRRRAGFAIWVSFFQPLSLKPWKFTNSNDSSLMLRMTTTLIYALR